jgi:hypothetical protein
MRHGVMFVGLNVPGSNNNKVMDDKDCTSKSARTPAQCAADNAEYAERDAANIAWMHDAFQKAKAEKAPGIMIVFQADLGFDMPETEEVDESFLDNIMSETKNFAGQVVIVHGDTHFFKVDKPLATATSMISNLTRVETFGSPNVHWIKVSVDPTSRDVFTFHPMIVPGN